MLPMLVQCTERDVAAPEAQPVPHAVPAMPGATLIVCQGSTASKVIKCGSDETTSALAGVVDGASGITTSASVEDDGTRIIGGQDQNVKLASANVVAAGNTFSFDVTIENLIPQALGTTDGVAPDANGIRVFFHQVPTVTGGTGSISIANADGTGTFTATGQPYYQYNEVLDQHETSAARGWQFEFDGDITFEFKVYVATALQYPDGWIEVTPPTGFVLAGGSQAATALVRDWDGTDASDQTVTWGSADEGVATVDVAGLVSGVTPGSVTITALQGTRSGSSAMRVCPNLAVGEVYTATFPAASDICLGGGAAEQEYTYMPINHSAASSLSLTLLANGIQAVTGPPSPLMAPETPNKLSAAFGAHAGFVQAAASEDFHMKMLEEDRQLAGRAQKITAASAEGDRLIVPGEPSLGDLWDLNVASGCSGALDIRTGQVRSISQHAIIVSDTANPPGGFTTAQYDSIALEFDTIAYVADTVNFGAPTDLDTNGRVVIFYTRAVNELSPPASSVIVLGYFTSRDLFSAAPTSCPRSNEGEMFYMMVPDPTGVVNSNVRTVSQVRGQTVGTTGHELQHLINAARRVYIEGAASLEEVWMNEGLSHIAEELMFYRTSVGLAPRGNIIVTQLTTGPNASRRVAAFNTYANQNYGRLRGWLQRPDTAGPLKSNDGLATRGAIWAFLRYAADRKGGDETQFWYDLVNTTLTGTANLADVTGATVTDWERDFTAAMYADDAVAGLSPIYTQPSWSFRSLYTALNGSYQLVPRPLTNGVGLTLSYSRGGGTAFARFGVPATGFATITALSGGVPPSSPADVIIVRTK